MKLDKLLALLLLNLAVTHCDDWEFKQLQSYEGIIDNGVLNMMVEYYENDEKHNTTQCKKDIITWKKSLSKLWAWEMLDAAGKFPHGILRGNIYGFGQFDECLAINDKASSIKGKYCPMILALPEINTDPTDSSDSENIISKTNAIGLQPSEELFLIWGVCLPHSCNVDEFKQVFNSTLESTNLTKSYIQTIDAYCSTDEPLEWSGLEISALVIFSAFGFVIFCSTLYDLIVRFYHKNKCRSHAVLISFSLYTNTEKLTKINKSSNSLRCLNGIRVLSLFWIILCHRYSNSSNNPLLNVLDAFDWKNTYAAMLIIGGGVAVDSFFVLSGLLLAYLFCSQHEKKTSFNVALFYLHRFVRLWPAMAAAIYFYTSLYRHAVQSPAWPLIFDTNMAPCREYWWSNLIYLQNYINPSKMCMGHLWYLAIDTQLYILSPILLLPLLKNKRFGVINMIMWLVISQITVIVIVYTNNWGGILPEQLNYWYAYYTATHTRAAVWLIGFTIGYIIYVTRNLQIKINIMTAVILWMISLIIMLSVVYGVKSMNNPTHLVNHLEDSTFNAFARTGWALALSWIIFACLKGYGGPVNWFLSLRIWEVLGRLSYSMYLVHVLIQTAQLGSAKSLAYFGHLDIIYLFFGDIVMTIFVSYLWSMAFESPFLAIEKALLYTEKKIEPSKNTAVNIESDIKVFVLENVNTKIK